MKRIKLAAIAVAALTVFSVCGCSSVSGNVPSAPVNDVVEDVVEDAVEDAIDDVVADVAEDVVEGVNEEAAAEEVNTEETEGSNAEYPSQLYSVDVYWSNEATGESQLEMYVYLDGKTIAQDVEEAYDENDALVYTKTEGYFEESKTVNIQYLIYSDQSTLEIKVEPIGGNNTSDIQTIEVEISNDMTGECYSYTFEDIGSRADTGVWYATVFSLEDGVMK